MSECEVINYIEKLKFKKRLIGLDEKEVLYELKNINNLYKDKYEKLEIKYHKDVEKLKEKLKISENRLNELLLEKNILEKAANDNEYIKQEEYYRNMCEKLSLKYLELEEEKNNIIKNARDEEVRAKEILLMDLKKEEKIYKDKLNRYKEKYKKLENEEKKIKNHLQAVKDDIDRIMS